MTCPEALKASAAMLTPSAWRSCRQDEKEDRPFAMPDAAERKVLELANAVEADHAGCRHQHAISEAGGEEYGAAVKSRYRARLAHHASVRRLPVVHASRGGAVRVVGTPKERLAGLWR